MHKKICSFCGHRDIFEPDVDEYVKQEIASLIKQGFNTFYSGGMGNFDLLCERTVLEFKKKNSEIKLCLILPYMTNRVNRYMNYYDVRFDEIIIPDFGNLHPRRAIPARNKWMVERSDMILAYVLRETGGASTTLRYAKKLGVEYVNITI